MDMSAEKLCEASGEIFCRLWMALMGISKTTWPSLWRVSNPRCMGVTASAISYIEFTRSHDANTSPGNPHGSDAVELGALLGGPKYEVPNIIGLLGQSSNGHGYVDVRRVLTNRGRTGYVEAGVEMRCGEDGCMVLLAELARLGDRY